MQRYDVRGQEGHHLRERERIHPAFHQDRRELLRCADTGIHRIPRRIRHRAQRFVRRRGHKRLLQREMLVHLRFAADRHLIDFAVRRPERYPRQRRRTLHQHPHPVQDHPDQVHRRILLLGCGIRAGKHHHPRTEQVFGPSGNQHRGQAVRPAPERRQRYVPAHHHRRHRDGRGDGQQDRPALRADHRVRAQRQQQQVPRIRDHLSPGSSGDHIHRPPGTRGDRPPGPEQDRGPRGHLHRGYHHGHRGHRCVHQDGQGQRTGGHNHTFQAQRPHRVPYGCHDRSGRHPDVRIRCQEQRRHHRMELPAQLVQGGERIPRFQGDTVPDRSVHSHPQDIRIRLQHRRGQDRHAEVQGMQRAGR